MLRDRRKITSLYSTAFYISQQLISQLVFYLWSCCSIVRYSLHALSSTIPQSVNFHMCLIITSSLWNNHLKRSKFKGRHGNGILKVYTITKICTFSTSCSVYEQPLSICGISKSSKCTENLPCLFLPLPCWALAAQHQYLILSLQHKEVIKFYYTLKSNTVPSQIVLCEGCYRWQNAH